MAVKFAAERGPVEGSTPPAGSPPVTGRLAMLVGPDGMYVDKEVMDGATEPVVRSASSASDKIRACGRACRKALTMGPCRGQGTLSLNACSAIHWARNKRNADHMLLQQSSLTLPGK